MNGTAGTPSPLCGLTIHPGITLRQIPTCVVDNCPRPAEWLLRYVDPEGSSALVLACHPHYTSLLLDEASNRAEERCEAVRAAWGQP